MNFFFIFSNGSSDERCLQIHFTANASFLKLERRKSEVNTETQETPYAKGLLSKSIAARGIITLDFKNIKCGQKTVYWKRTLGKWCLAGETGYACTHGSTNLISSGV